MGCLNINGINNGKLEDLENECTEWKIDMIGLTETHMRDTLDIMNKESKYKFISKGRRKQCRKGGGVAVMFKKDAQFDVEVIDVGDCEMSEDILVVRVEMLGGESGRREELFVCVCYMTVEGQNAQFENKKKYDILQKFVSEHGTERIIVMGDMNGHIGILGERINENGELLRGFCEEMRLEIFNETIANGRITWQSRDSTSAIDYVLASIEARERVTSMSIDEEGCFNVGSDHNLLLVEYRYRVRKCESRVCKKRKKWCLRNMNWEKFKEDMNAMTGVEVTEIIEMNNEITENIRKSAKKSIVMSTSKVHSGKYNPWWNRQI